ncbi:MAG: hypothetical protein UY09_C0022G0012 [Parcubacteria group bacterium GW2011_GWA2_47_8]|nr:MAG: hypothetical protein UY09_C0022G0012 [Parcubacteria group bacterium GW2011_GWA2_47_8]
MSNPTHKPSQLQTINEIGGFLDEARLLAEKEQPVPEQIFKEIAIQALAQINPSKPMGTAFFDAMARTALRPGEDPEDLFRRLEQGEFECPIVSKRFIGNLNCPGGLRGHFFTPVYLVVIRESEKSSGKWFSVDNLPHDTVDHHAERLIPFAVEAFERMGS